MGKMQRRKGVRAEQKLVNLFREWGLRSDRVPLSGSHKRSDGSGGHDVDVWPTPYLERIAPLTCELKARKSFPKWLTDYLGDNDFLALKADRQEHLFIVPERIMKELMTGEME